jgi:hypothetical protein
MKLKMIALPQCRLLCMPCLQCGTISHLNANCYINSLLRKTCAAQQAHLISGWEVWLRAILALLPDVLLH